MQTEFKMQTDKKNCFLRQKRVNIRFYNFVSIVLFIHAKPFHRVFMAVIPWVPEGFSS